MTLYEFANVGIGESYLRCYVWAKDSTQAHEIANHIHQEQYGKDLPKDAACRPLFNSERTAFGTDFTDHGWPDD